MNPAKLYAGGQELHVEKRIGKGGEGEVFSISNLQGFAVKTYFPQHLKEREPKIKAMVAARLADTTKTVAFPHQVAFNAKGEFVGFIMKLVEKHREIHELQTPVSRQKYFPKADYRFLVRVALNIARAFAQVHSTGCVVGDINQRGILVSLDATVALIDADSFQVTDGNRRFPCVVGVPEYTPPELQGQSLKNVSRTPDHDAFGLAVCLFQLLCMDRHPFSGRFSGQGDMPIEKAITEHRFAYSTIRNTGMSPPPGSVRLPDFTPRVAELFEKAFAAQTAGHRPRPSEWIDALDELEKSLRVCAKSKLHHYARQASECPWCRMEQGGRALFVDTDFGNISLPTGRIDQQSGLVLDLGALLSAINAIPLPNAVSIPIPPSTSGLQPSQAALAKKLRRDAAPLFKLLAVAPIAAAWFLVTSTNVPGIVPFALIGVAIWSFFRGAGTEYELPAAYRNKAAEIVTHVETLQQSSPIDRTMRKKAELLAAIDEFKSLSRQFASARTDYDRTRRQRQLDAFLASYNLRGAHISKVKSSDIAALASFGISTAYDAKRQDVQQVYGIGPVKSSNIAAWVSRIEARFQFQSDYTSEDQTNIRKMQAEIISKQQGLEDRLKKLVDEYRSEARGFELWRGRPDTKLVEMCRELDQIEVDIRCVGVAAPARPSPSPYTPPPVSSFTRTTHQAARTFGSANTRPHVGTIPNCPHCNSKMVRRVARRGSRRGNAFWGCSRYPSCSGTRPI